VLFRKALRYKEDRDALDLRSKALDEKEKELDERSNDLQQFMDQTLALAKQFSGGGGSSSSKKKTLSKVHFNLPSSSTKRSTSVSPSLTSKDSAVKALLMVKKVCVCAICVLLF
jgi:F0F1-type ATP synthase beta subunit